MENFELVVGSKDCPVNTVVLTLWRSSLLISNEWTTLAMGLDIRSEHVRRLRDDRLLNKINNKDVIWEVLELWVAENGSTATVGKLLNVVEEQCGANDAGESLRLQFGLPCKAADSNPLIDWKDISPAFQNQIIETFQKFFPTLNFSEALPNLKGSWLIKLMNGKKPPLPSPLVHSFPDKLCYYINRTLITRDIISETIFEQNSEDIFLLTGIDVSELSALAGNKLTGSSSDQLRDDLTVKFMILDRAYHFETICKKTDYPVHLLKREDDGRLRWISSRGGMDNLWKYIDQTQDEFDEAAFCRHLNSRTMPVVICDSPGMGKSVLLAQIGTTLSQLYPYRTVRFIVLTEFIKLIKSIELKDQIQRIDMALQKLCSKPAPHSYINLDETLVYFELLLDGFDELDSVDYILALAILKNISISFKSIRLWVTSRPHLMEELETSLNVLGYNIRPFCEQDQVQFLSSFWSRKEKLDEERNKLFALKCLQFLKSKMDSPSHDIAGIPLQCLLIGEVYEKAALEYARLEDKNGPPMEFEIEIGTIASLYRSLIRKKIEKYASLNGKLAEDELMTIHAQLGLELLFHDKLETLKLGPNPNESDIAEMFKIGIIEKSSIMESSYAFMHRTFAEYLVAWFVADKLKRKGEWTEKINDFFLHCILECQDTRKYFDGDDIKSFEFVKPVICYFLNSFICDLRVGKNYDHIYSQLDGGSAELMSIISQACANADLVHIFKLFHARYEFDEDYTSTIFTKGFLLRSIEHSSLELVKPVVHQLEQKNKFKMKIQGKALCNAVRLGKFSIVEFLIKEKQLGGIVKDLQYGTRKLVYDCIKESVKCSDGEIKNKIQVLRMLIRINESLLNAKVDGRAPLLFGNVHVKLLIELIRFGADVFVEHQDYTVLHFYTSTLDFLSTHCRNFSSSDYQTLLMSIPDESLRKLVHRKAGKQGHTPLTSALEWIDPTPETLDIFRRVDADFNHTLPTWSSMLALAIIKGRNAVTIRKLIQHGNINVLEDTKAKTAFFMRFFSPYQRTNLLHIAAEWGNVEAVRALVDECRIDVNSKDEHGLTPLDIAIKRDNDDVDRFRIGLILRTRGGRFKDDKSLLHVAAAKGNIQSVRLLISFGVDVNRKDNKGNTALHTSLELKRGYSPHEFTIVQLLLKNGADPIALNKMNETSFHTALKNENLNLKIFLLIKSKAAENNSLTPALCDIALKFALRRKEALPEEEFISIINDFCRHHQENVCLIENDGNFAVHVAADQGYLKSLQLLVDKGVDINLKNKLGQTPLHVVACNKPKGYMIIVKFLIENGADVYANDKQDRSFLHQYILTRPSPSAFHLMVEYLIEAKFANLFIFENNCGVLPLQLAVENLAPEIKTLQLLYLNNVNFNAFDHLGHSILVHALKGYRSLEFISALINLFDVDWRVIDKQGCSILHHAVFVEDRSSDYLKFFLELKELNVNEINNGGETPLFCAASKRDTKNVLEMCKLLVAHGADVNISNRAGRTPFELVEWMHDGVDKNELLELLRISIIDQTIHELTEMKL